MAWPEQFQTADALPALGCALGAYVIGCFATGYYLVRARTGRDIREIESGSIGARNVGRVLGKSGFLITLGGDFAKGALAVLAARHFSSNDLFAAIALLFVAVGHIWPAPLGFRGGKGVATSLGALVVFDFQLALAYGAAFVIGFAFVRRTTLPGLAAYLVLPFVSYWLRHNHFEATTFATLAALVIFAHRQNLLEEFPALALRRGITDKPQHTKS
jgi:glycerol-3-phosphate acyltransferase PlsY